MERAQRFVARLLEWAEKMPFRDFAYRHETDPCRKLCLAVLLQRSRPLQVDKAYTWLFPILPTTQGIPLSRTVKIGWMEVRTTHGGLWMSCPWRSLKSEPGGPAEPRPK